VPTKNDIRGFEAAIQALLAPLARHARQNGINARRFAQIVGAAARDRALRVTPELPYEAGVRLVGRWCSDPLYSRAKKPKLLPAKGRGSFASLVRAAGAGSAERARRSLLASGLVKEDARGRLRLLQNAYIPGAAQAEKLEILGHAGAEFLRVLTHNLSSAPGETFLQRAASYDNIGASSLTMLRRALRREGLGALERANRLLAATDRDRNPRARGGRRTRVSFGLYLLEEPVGGARRRKKR